MKFAVTWYDHLNDEDCSLEGTKEFAAGCDLGDMDEDIYNRIQQLVTSFENEGITIDQGGDDVWYEFDLPDHGHDHANDDEMFQLPHRLLDAAEALLKEGD